LSSHSTDTFKTVSERPAEPTEAEWGCDNVRHWETALVLSNMANRMLSFHLPASCTVILLLFGARYRSVYKKLPTWVRENVLDVQHYHFAAYDHALLKDGLCFAFDGTTNGTPEWWSNRGRGARVVALVEPAFKDEHKDTENMCEVRPRATPMISERDVAPQEKACIAVHAEWKRVHDLWRAYRCGVEKFNADPYAIIHQLKPSRLLQHTRGSQ
jgi:hypothetical protein